MEKKNLGKKIWKKISKKMLEKKYIEIKILITKIYNAV